jgi:hypothetical protein
MQKYIDKTKSLILDELFLKNIPKTPEVVFSKGETDSKEDHEKIKKSDKVLDVKYMDELYSKAFLDEYFSVTSPPKT